MKVKYYSILLIFLLVLCVKSFADVTEDMKRKHRELVQAKPEAERIQYYKNCIDRIENQLRSEKGAGRASFGGALLYAESLGLMADFEKQIEVWFKKYGDINPYLTDLVYKQNHKDLWFKLFKEKYPYTSNLKVRYKMRFYAFSENFVLPQTDSCLPKSQYTGLEIQLEPVDSESFEEFKLKITNTSKHDIFVFPQTEEVATSWSRKDGVPLPNKTSSKYDAEKSTGLFFIFPGDSLHRQLNLKAVERNKTFYRSSDVVFLKNKHNFTCINGVYLAMDQEALPVEMKAYLVPFSPSTGKMLQSDLKSKFGHKASRIHVIQEPLFSNPIDLVVQQGAILGLKSK